MPILKKLVSWSYSTYSLWKQCPLKVKLTKIDKLKEPSTLPLAGGSVKHKQAENYIKGLPAPEFVATTALVLGATGWPGPELFTKHVLKQGQLPLELEKWRADFEALRARWKKKTKVIIVEADWAFNAKWEKTGWFDKDAWLRVKLDCAYEEEPGILILRDWKSGKFKEAQNVEYQEQVELYALAAFIQLPFINEVRPRLDYLDTGESWPKEVVSIHRKDLPKLIKKWTAQVKPMMADGKFAPKPNRFCNWCHFRASNGGPCAY